jgi:predicted nucleic acid-binding protein
MIVVADTTPLRYLVAIDCEHLLPALYGRVLIPPAVAEELNHESTPEVVREWLASRPSWLEIRRPDHSLGPEVDLDWGEREAIALVEEVSADLLLVDDAAGTLRVLADGAGPTSA